MFSVFFHILSNGISYLPCNTINFYMNILNINYVVINLYMNYYSTP